MRQSAHGLKFVERIVALDLTNVYRAFTINPNPMHRLK
jgi:hypothetical protein